MKEKSEEREDEKTSYTTHNNNESMNNVFL
jgi:hypothetical protein